MTQEHTDLIATLDHHRMFLRQTVARLSDDQARLRPTVSALSLGGLIKHVARTEAAWANFIVQGSAAFGSFYDQFAGGADVDWTAPADDPRGDEFTMAPDETLVGLLGSYDTVADRTAGIVAATPDLDVGHPLPEAPWFEPGASWSARRVLLHLIAETSQHAGHADILRESIDGQRTMG
jgi:hypothetical protein